MARTGELIRRVRAVEAADPDGARWPRSKIRDDVTIAYWPMEPPGAGFQERT